MPNRSPIGQVIGINIGNIIETAFLRDQRNGIRRATPRVPAARPFPRDFGVQAHGPFQMCALLFGWHIPVFDPLEAVACDFPIGGLHRRNLRGRPRQRRRHPIDGDRDAEACEQPVKSPETGAGAVFVDRLHVPVPLAGPGRRADDLGKERLRGGVAMQDAVLAAFLVIDDELHGDSRATGPFRIGGLGAVPVQVSWVSQHCFLRPADHFR